MMIPDSGSLFWATLYMLPNAYARIQGGPKKYPLSPNYQ